MKNTTDRSSACDVCADAYLWLFVGGELDSKSLCPEVDTCRVYIRTASHLGVISASATRQVL